MNSGVVRFLVAWPIASLAAGASGIFAKTVFDRVDTVGFNVAGAIQSVTLALFSLVLPFFWAAAFMVGAYVALPILAFGLIAMAVSTAWRPAGHWMFWVGSATAFALVWHPWIDSRFIDPLPANDDTVMAITAAAAGALVLWLFVCRKNSGHAELSQSRLIMAGAVPALLIASAITWRTDYAASHATEVRWEPRDFRSTPTNDRRPVVVELLEFRREESDESQFRTTGKSLRFRFPMAYFRELKFQRGGSHGELWLHARSSDFRPLDAAIGIPPPDDIGLELVSGNSVAAPNFARRSSRIIERDANKNLGVYCGFRFAYEGYSSAMLKKAKASWPTSFDQPGTEVSGATIHVNEHDVKGALCLPRQKCLIGFGYRGFEGQYWISRKEFCSWPQQTARVRRFLDDHLVATSASRRGKPPTI